MVRSRPISALALVLALGMLAQARGSEADDSIEMLVGRTPPNVRWENGRLTGYWVELSRLAAQKANVQITEFLNLPYQRSLQELTAASHACHPFVPRTPKNEASYRWVAPTRRIVTTVFVTADLPNPPRTLEQLRQHEIAVQRGTLGDHALEEMGVPATRVTDTSRLAILLAHHRVSVFVAEYASGFASAKEAAVLVKEAMPLADTVGYFVCSPRIDAAIADRLATAINGIFAAGVDRPLAAADGMDAATYDRVRPPSVPAALGQPTQ
ncbi:MAG TPA: transporter substrate-binding domain-containing protein [Dongiaceae bacterium]|jgi:ABC-type amino acid transport substrate-binding protein|nr:transporter substrate-binding domain-containing protein [Dongiaceae bacterium]